LAIRPDNPPRLSRWCPGGGLYRKVWLTKTRPLHVGQWGTCLMTRRVSTSSATIDLEVTIDNDSNNDANVRVAAGIYVLDGRGWRAGNTVASIEAVEMPVAAAARVTVKGSVTISQPRLWESLPRRMPAMSGMVSLKKPFMDAIALKPPHSDRHHPH
jgi:beta-galactosidase